jgi:hypothetical protein
MAFAALVGHASRTRFNVLASLGIDHDEIDALSLPRFQILPRPSLRRPGTLVLTFSARPPRQAPGIARLERSERLKYVLGAIMPWS